MKYIGIKFVDAVPMTAADAEKKGYRTNGHTGDGYEITYPDADHYKSWCPKDIFEAHNSTIKNEELAHTCERMVSPDYKERFIAEYIQLRNRLNGLRRMLQSWDAGTLNFKPTCPRELYDTQVKGMEMYQEVLVKRSVLEGVDLQKV